MHSNQAGDRLLTGARAIADELGQPVRRVVHWLQNGQIKSARKVGDLWTAGRFSLRREYGLSVE